MPREQLQLLAGDVDRLLAAGASVAAGDEKLRQRSARLRELGQKVPVLAQIADAVDRTVNAPPKQVTPALLDLLLVVRHVRASLTAAGVDGAVDSLPSSGPWTTAAPTRDLEGWVEALTTPGPNRPRKLKKAMEHAGFTDLRLVTPLLRALNANHQGLTRLIAEKALPAFGKAVLPELENGLDLQGKRGDARRLQAICVLDKERGAALCRQALTDGSAPVKIQGLKSLSRIAPKETENAALALLEQKAGATVHAAAYYALATAKSDEALEALLMGVLGAKGEDWHILQNASGSLTRLAHPKATARLLEELAKAQEEVRTHQAAKGKKAAAPKGKTAQAKAAQKGARLLQQAIERAQRLMNLLGSRRDHKAVPALVELLDHPLADLRQAAGEALVALRDPDGLRAVAERMEDKQLYGAAIRATWDLPAREQFDRLQPVLATLSQPKPTQRQRGEIVLNLFSWELNLIGGPDAEDELEEDGEYDAYDDEYADDEEEYADDESGDGEESARERRTDWDSRWIPALRKHLKGPCGDQVAMALAVLEGEKMVPELLKMLPASATKGQVGVINALLQLRVREAVPHLVALFSQKGVNIYAIYNTLRRLGDPAAIAPLQEQLKKIKDYHKKSLIEWLIEDLQRRAARDQQT